MSTSSKITIGIVVVIILIVAVLGWGYFVGNPFVSLSETATSTVATTTSEAMINPSPDINSSTDSSDLAIDQDLSAIDAQLKNLDADSAVVDQSLKNQVEAPIQ